MSPSSSVTLHHVAQPLLYHSVKKGGSNVYKFCHFRVSVEIFEFLLHAFKFGKLSIGRDKVRGTINKK